MQDNMDKNELAQQILSKYKLNGYVPPERQPLDLQSRFAELDAIASGTETSTGKKKQSVIEKIGNVTGGTKIGQGLGQAIANKEISKSIEDTQAQQIDIQSKLLNQIRENKTLGKDTSRLENALKLITEDVSQTGETAGQLLNQNNLTPKQVIGDALQLGTTVLGAGQLPGVAKKAVAETGILAGAKQGAIQGAKAGAIYGASSGASNALKEDKSLVDVAKSTAGGALAGAATGGLVGGTIGAVSGGIKGAKLAKQEKDINFRTDLVSPKATEEIKRQALKEGRVTEQGLLSAGRITPSKRDIQLADAVDGFVSSKKSPTQNIASLDKGVKEINSGVKAYVKTNKVPFNTNQLKSQLNTGKDELKLIFASDKQAEKTYDAVVKEFMKHVKSKDTAGLLDARQEFDKIPAIKKLLQSQGLGENVKKEIVLTARGKANEYIASLLPEGNQFRDTLLRESKMIEAIGNIADKNTGVIGANKLQALTKRYPVLYWLLGGAAAGILGGAGIGVGRAITNSTE